jgi:hypothetical protein
MTRKRIRVGDIGPGIFSSERSVSFEAGGKHYNLIVDADQLQDNTLVVQVVAEGDKEALIDLPQETSISGNRIRILKEQLLPV